MAITSAPKLIAWSKKALNLISALHKISGLGVRPALYSLKKLSNTRSLYSALKLTASISMPILSAIETASIRSCLLEQYSSVSSSSQFFMKRPVTSYPCSLSNRAVTDESTPPERPTTTFFFCSLFKFMLCYFVKFNFINGSLQTKGIVVQLSNLQRSEVPVGFA